MLALGCVLLVSLQGSLAAPLTFEELFAAPPTIKQTCGIAAIKPNLVPNQIKVNPNPRIVGGVEAIPNSWPWGANLISTARNQQICGGSVLNANWVMTAGHCCTAFSASPKAGDFDVRVGAHNVALTNEPFAKVYKLSKVVVHPDYKFTQFPFSMSFDFCLLKTATPIVFNKAVSPVCLATAAIGTAGQKCWATGWGLTKASPRTETNVNMQVDLDIADQSKCGNKEPTHTVCATNNNKSGCMGDSGGPLVCQDKSGAFQLVGATSYGPGTCTSQNGPSNYARISFVRSWIDTTIAT